CKFLLFYSGGNLGVDQGNLILLAFALMLIVVIPVLIMSVAFPLWYSNKDADYQPNWSHSSVIEFFAWGIPILIIAVLGYTTYITSHSMDPRKSLVGKYEGAEQKEVVIQAVSMDWKWVFFYPDQDIATVNEIAIPVNTPIKFQITSDTVMNSFFIPELGSQIYAMGGMENRLHLISKRIKTMRGISANYSGFGFSGMKFNVISTDKKGFENWIKKVKSSNVKFDQAAYSRLKGKQTKDHRVEYFSDVVDSEQFENIIRKYLKTH
ncbi:MAG: ubiquinol oxidase subunit II, partial [Alphaproteobacteria bacterium]